MRQTVELLVSVTLAVLLAGSVALAAVSDLPDEGTVGANGRISDILVSDGKVYLAGSFTQLIDTDGTTVARNRLAAIDANTGEVTPWNPNANNTVRTLALSADGSRLFAGGNFSSVGGVTRNHLAAINPATGAVDRGWAAGINSAVWTLTVSGSRLYLGGDFTKVKGEPRERLAAVDAETAALDPNWTPRAHRLDGNRSTVYAMDVSDDGSRVYVGGLFNHISDIRTEKLAALDATTGVLDPRFLPATGNHIIAMEVSGGSVYVGTGDPLEGIESFDATTGELRWFVAGGHPDPAAGDVQAITVWGDTVYAGGHFAQMGGLVRKRLVEVDADTGQIGPWAPEIPAGSGLGVWALEADASRGKLYAGGDFTQIEGIGHERFASFSEIEDCTISGTANSDLLEGTPGPDVICGAEGNDTIKGLGGNDILRGGKGSDQLIGGEGDDTVDGGLNGIDSASFSDSPAAVNASLAEGIATGEGSDSLSNIESLVGSSLGDTLDGSSVGDTLNGAGGNDTLDGLEGTDKLIGGPASDTLSGGTGNDSLVGSGGADDLFGEEDDDTLNSTDGINANDSLDGGIHVTGDTCITDGTERSVTDCEL
jgi:Ca2+-binding RTX toxin-like protein